MRRILLERRLLHLGNQTTTDSSIMKAATTAILRLSVVSLMVTPLEHMQKTTVIKLQRNYV